MYGGTSEAVSYTHLLRLVGLKEENFKKSPFELSGGQKRRVAIAGILAMEPDVLVLDEPTAGLDPKGRDDILDQVKRLHEERHITVILVSHSMEDVARYVDRIIVMNKGQVRFDGVPREVFRHYREDVYKRQMQRSWGSAMRRIFVTKGI